MSTIRALPPSLRDQLARVSRRIRRLRAVRGVSLLLLLLALTGGGALLADYYLDLPVPVRERLLATWIALGLGTALFGLIVPLCRRLDPAALAAVIEEKHPDLSERLTSTVELAGASDRYHGSPALIHLLITQTAAQTHPLNFLDAFSARATGRLAAAAVAVALLALSPALPWPDQYLELGQRFLFPWHIPVPYSLAVQPGNTVAARGRPLSLAVRVHPRSRSVALPASCTLVRTDAAGSLTRLPMSAGQPEVYSVTLDKDQVTADFRYHVEAGTVVSDSYQVTAIDPVDLATDGATVTALPPAYAATLKPQTAHSLAKLTPLQYGQVRFEFRFTRPVVTAILERSPRTGQKPHGNKTEDGTRQDRLELSPDHAGASVQLTASAEGTFGYKLLLTDAHGIPNDPGLGTLIVKADQPPVFDRVASSDRLMAAWQDGAKTRKIGKQDLNVLQPSDSVPLEVAVSDDVAVARLEVEYRIGDRTPQLETMPLQGEGTPAASTNSPFRLDGKVQEGDVVHFRLKATDNRRVPQAGLGPNVTYYPADHWLTVKVARQAERLPEQEITAERDDINQRLEAIQRRLRDEHTNLFKLRTETRNQAELKPEDLQSLRSLHRENRTAENELRRLARAVREIPALQPVAERVHDVAEQEMRRSEEHLDEAEQRQRSATRPLQSADQELQSAIQRLEELRRQNDRLAQARLDQIKLETLAARERQLADRTAEQATRDPVKDPDAQKKAAALQRDQEELANELRRQAEQNEALRDALDAFRASQTRQLAQQARHLAEAERDLARAEQETKQKEKQDKFDDLARRQQAVAEQAKQLARETRPQTQAAHTNPLRSEDAERAAEALKQGKTDQALQQQDQSARELERVAGDLERALKLSDDPREAARQLAGLQENLKQRLTEQARHKDAEPLPALQRQQQAIRQAAEQLAAPLRNPEAQKAQKEAVENAAKAADALQKSNRRQAAARMEQARQALERLAQTMPRLEERQRQALAEVGRLLQQQQEIAHQAGQAAREVEKEDPNSPATRERLAHRLAEAARKQAEAAERLGKMDAPKQAARQERAQEAVNRALADLMDARPQDIEASQQEARRQLERLAEALAGRKPADEKAQELARQQRVPAASPTPAGKPAAQSPRQLAQDLERLQRELAQATQQAQRQADKQPGDKGKEGLKQALSRLGLQQHELNERASRLPVDQAPRALEQARHAMNQAQHSLAKNDAAQAQQRQREAANALARLARELPEHPSASAPQHPAQDADNKPAAPQGLPNPQQVQQARQLAKEQRELREATRRLAGALIRPAEIPPQNPLAELARRQEEVARQAGELDRQVGQEGGQRSPSAQQAHQAAQSAQEAAKHVQAGALQQAQQAGRQTAQQLRQLAQVGPAQAAQPARELAQRQEELNRQMEPLAQDTGAQRAQQQARQQDLRQQTAELGKELGQMARQLNRSPQARDAANQAMGSSHLAEQQMQQAQAYSRQPWNTAQVLQNQAARSLDQAARQADQAAAQQSSRQAQPASAPSTPQAGQAVRQAQGQMSEAQAKLAQGQPQSAQGAMQQAAQALQQAAQQLAAQQQSPAASSPPGPPTSTGSRGRAGREPSLLEKHLDPKYAGKPWGELPGELRTKILQDVKAQYGEDYARIIRLYFERVADKK